MRKILSAPGFGGGGGPRSAMTVIDLAFWRDGVYRKPDSDSVLQWECPERLFKKGS